jgi:hypothetical protein
MRNGKILLNKNFLLPFKFCIQAMKCLAMVVPSQHEEEEKEEEGGGGEEEEGMTFCL